VAEEAGIQWKHNVLRHSFASYRLAQIPDLLTYSGVHRHQKEGIGGRIQECGPGMGTAPRLFVAAVTARWEELVEHCRQVLLKSGFEFDRADGTRAADIKNVCHSNADT